MGTGRRLRRHQDLGPARRPADVDDGDGDATGEAPGVVIDGGMRSLILSSRFASSND